MPETLSQSGCRGRPLLVNPHPTRPRYPRPSYRPKVSNRWLTVTSVPGRARIEQIQASGVKPNALSLPKVKGAKLFVFTRADSKAPVCDQSTWLGLDVLTQSSGIISSRVSQVHLAVLGGRFCFTQERSATLRSTPLCIRRNRLWTLTCPRGSLIHKESLRVWIS